MNKVNVIKQNLEFIGKTWIKYIGTFASILSLFFCFGLGMIYALRQHNINV